MLKGGGLLINCVDMHAALMGKGAAPHIGHVAAQGKVGDICNFASSRGQLAETLLRNTGKPQINLQVGDNRAQIGVAASLPKAKKSSLHMGCASLYGGQGVGHGKATVVMTVDAGLQLREGMANCLCSSGNSLGVRAAVGIAKTEHLGTAFGV